MPKQTLAELQVEFTIHSFTPETRPDARIFDQDIYFLAKTEDELSVVVPSSLELKSLDKESGWRCLEVMGPLNFSLTGILSGIAGALAEASISIFAISTFDTDYILVKKDSFAQAIAVLEKNDYKVNQLNKPQ
ncbi:MAG: amino acid-binding protein [Gammaproteobacteria bacterium MedPE]|nr:MAG: amino acid-binding protein [Gammaproteobacteria bacterium MedPE]